METLMYLAGYAYGMLINSLWYVGFIAGLCYYLWPIPLNIILAVYFIRKAHRGSA